MDRASKRNSFYSGIIMKTELEIYKFLREQIEGDIDQIEDAINQLKTARSHLEKDLKEIQSQRPDLWEQTK